MRLRRLSAVSPPTVLSLLLLIAFLPLLAGFNFLPFSRYPEFTMGYVKGTGQTLAFDHGYQERFIKNPWVYEVEPAWFTLELPQALSVAKGIRRGETCIWDPFTGAGNPTFGSGQFHPFSPLFWLFYIWPSFWTYCAGLFLGLAAGTWGAWLWLSRKGCGRWGCAVGCAVFSLNPWVLDRLALADAAAYFLLPWCLLAFARVRSNDWSSIALATLVLTFMGYVGHPEACLALCGVVMLHYITAPSAAGGAKSLFGRLRERLKMIAIIGGCATATLMLAILPLLQFLANGFSYKKFSIPLSHPYSLKGLVFLSSDLFMVPVVAGLVAAAIFRVRRPLFWLVLAGASAIIVFPMPVLGHHPAEWLQRITGLPSFYLKPVLWASLAFIAPEGIPSLRLGSAPCRLAASITVAAVFLLDLLAFMFFPFAPAEQTAYPVLAFVLLIGGSACFVLVAWKRALRKYVAVAALAGIIPLAFPLSLNFLDWNRLHLRSNEAAEWVHREAPHARTVSPAFHPAFVIPPNWGQAFDVRCGEQNTVIFPNKYFPIYHDKHFPPTLIIFSFPELVAFRQMGASLMLLPRSQALPGIRELAHGPWASIYEIAGASGRLFFAQRAASYDANNPSMTKQIMALSQTNDEVAVIETMGLPHPAAWPECDKGSWSAQFVEDGTQIVSAQVRCDCQAVFVLKDSWYPGWVARVDGTKVPIYRVNGCFRGVIVPAGEHKVVFEYKPTLIYVSGAISLLVTLALLLAAFWPRALHGGQEKPA